MHQGRDRGSVAPASLGVIRQPHCHQQSAEIRIAETKRSKELSVAWTRVRIASGRLDERPHADAVSSERRPLVDVVVDELVVDEIRNRAGRDLLLLRLSEEKRRRVDGRPEGCIEGNRPPEPWEQALPELQGRQTGPAEVDDRPGEVLVGEALLHGDGHAKTPRSPRQVDAGTTLAITSY